MSNTSPNRTDTEQRPAAKGQDDEPSAINLAPPPTVSAEKSPPPRKRAGRVSKTRQGIPAKHDPGPPLTSAENTPPQIMETGFDPAVFANEHGLGWLTEKDKFVIRDPKGEFVELSDRKFRKVLGGELRMKAQEGEVECDYDRLIKFLILHRQVDHVLSFLAGHRAGFYDFQGTRTLVKKAPQIIEQAEGDFGYLQRFIVSLLPVAEDGVPQWMLFCAWLKRGIEDVRAGRTRQSQILILAGARDTGKNRLQEQVITDCLDGRWSDPIDYLTGETGFNADMAGAAHLMSSDPASSLKKDERIKFKQRLKQMAVQSWHRIHPKGVSAVLLPPVWRVSISINTGPDDLALVPPATPDFADKAMILQTAKAEGLPGPDIEAQAEFRALIRRELPAFIHFLLHDFDALLPNHLRDSRYGVRSYEHPGVRASMQEERPEIQLLQMLDEAMPWLKGGDKGCWKGKWTALQALLEDDSETSGEMERWIKHNSLTRNLSRLAEEQPKRVSYARHGKKGGLWKIFPPQDEE